MSGIDDAYTVVLLHMNGADASTTFTDESGKAWTRAGAAQIDTAQSKFGGASGLFAAGTTDDINTPDLDIWQLDDGSNSTKWTVDFWCRFNGDPGVAIMGFISQRSAAATQWNIRLNNNALELNNGDGSIAMTKAWNPATAVWYHVAVVKDGTTYYMFVDGTLLTSSYSSNAVLQNVPDTLKIGKSGTADYFTGWLDEFRISRGIARWTTGFALPVGEYDPFTPQIRFYA